MRAVQQLAFGGPEVLELAELPDPVAGPGELLVEVELAGVNFADTHQRRNEYLAEADYLEVTEYGLPQEPPADPSANGAAAEPWRPAIHLPLADPYQPPEGYFIKANTHSGLYYTPDSALYDNTLPEVWFASEDVAQANGFVRAPE